MNLYMHVLKVLCSLEVNGSSGIMNQSVYSISETLLYYLYMLFDLIGIY